MRTLRWLTVSSFYFHNPRSATFLAPLQRLGEAPSMFPRATWYELLRATAAPYTQGQPTAQPTEPLQPSFSPPSKTQTPRQRLPARGAATSITSPRHRAGGPDL